MAVKLDTYQEIEQLINEILEECKSPRAEKRMLNRMKKEAKENIEELKEILTRPKNRRYRLGENINRADLYNARLELRVLENTKLRLQ